MRRSDGDKAAQTDAHGRFRGDERGCSSRPSDEPNVLLTLLPSVSTVGCPGPRHKLDISGNPTSGSSTTKSSKSVGCR